MNEKLRKDAEQIARSAIRAVSPERAVIRALQAFDRPGILYLVACGKAAWTMADVAKRELGDRVKEGIVITKYHHAMGPIEKLQCFEAGHPVPDELSFSATQKVLDMTASLTEDDTVLFLLSGGGSALFEKPACSGEDLFRVTDQLLAKGASIVEINTVRKRLSLVKGGRFAEWCAPAHIEAIILSDILGDPLDMIASGPCVADSTTCADAVRIAKKYELELSPEVEALLNKETPKEIRNVNTTVIGSVKELCKFASIEAENLGYEVVYLTDYLNTEASKAGEFLSAILKSHKDDGRKIAFIAGGETVVHVTGGGKGGRNQELALAGAVNLSGIPNAALISVGSDGTDGPTDAAGGYSDGDTRKELSEKGISIEEVLKNNDAYNALKACGGLIFTGPTGTNVNDVTVGLVDGI